MHRCSVEQLTQYSLLPAQVSLREYVKVEDNLYTVDTKALVPEDRLQHEKILTFPVCFLHLTHNWCIMWKDDDRDKVLTFPLQGTSALLNLRPFLM